MTKQEKLKEASRLRDIIRKRANRLKEYEQKTGQSSDALDSLKENRRKYDQFDPDTGHVGVSITKDMTEQALDELLKQEKAWLKNKTSTVGGARKANIERNKKTGEMLADLTDDESFKDADYSDFWNKLSELRKGIKDKPDSERTAAEKQILSDLKSDAKYKEIFEEIADGLEKGWNSKKIGQYLKASMTKKINKEVEKRKQEQEALRKQTGEGLPSDIKSAREAVQRRQETGRLQGNKDRTKQPKGNKKR